MKKQGEFEQEIKVTLEMKEQDELGQENKVRDQGEFGQKIKMTLETKKHDELERKNKMNWNEKTR